MKRVILFSFLLFVLAVVGLGLYLRHELQAANPLPVGETVIIEIPRGLGSQAIVDLLVNRQIIRNRYATLAYLIYTRSRNKLQAGEYLFDRPMTIPEIVNKLASGAVLLHKFVVPEGLTVEQTSQKWEEQGFGTAQEFRIAAIGAVDLVRDLDDKAESVEGYLFPETYSFPVRTTPRQAIESMIHRFRQVMESLKKDVPPSEWPQNLHDTTILASMVESEAARAEERPLIASVYLNRLMRNILLQCDPTVIYALERVDQYRGSLRLTDLRFNSPYNTYVNPGLPPGPIANPGYASLLASVRPAMTNYLFFVRTTESRHTFSETLAAHNKAVALYRKASREVRGRRPD